MKRNNYLGFDVLLSSLSMRERRLLMFYYLFMPIVFVIAFAYYGRNNTAPIFFWSAIGLIYFYYKNSNEYLQISFFSWFLSLIGFTIVSFVIMYFAQKRIENVYSVDRICNVLPRYPAIVGFLAILAFIGWTYYDGAEKISSFSATIIWITSAAKYFLACYITTWFIISWGLLMQSFVPKTLKI